LRSYNLSEHSFFVALLYIDLCREDELEPSARQLEAVLKHDYLEVLTADLPYPVKNLNATTQTAWAVIEREIVGHHGLSGMGFDDAELKAILGNTWNHFKTADMLELLQFCLEDQALGNLSHLNRDVIRTCKQVLDSKYHSSTIVYEAVGLETDEWEAL
jgi:5'-deoxynucleotidase YfbR-like HD superfamily hydrolase